MRKIFNVLLFMIPTITLMSLKLSAAEKILNTSRAQRAVLENHLTSILKDDGIASQYVNLGNGQKLHYLSKGNPQKPLVIFLHGFPEFSLAWKNQLNELGKSYFVVAPDMRGYALSAIQPNVTDYNMSNLTEDVLLLSQKVSKHKKFSLVAHDWGAVVAWSYAYAFPETLNHLIVLNGPNQYIYRHIYNTPNSDQKKKSSYIDAIRTGILLNEFTYTALNNAALKKTVFSELSEAKTFFSDRNITDAYDKAWNISSSITAQLKYYKALVFPPPPIPAEGIGIKLKIPTMFIWGTLDPWISQDNIKDEYLKLYLEDYTVVKVPTAGHWVNHEASSIVNQKIIEFID